MHRRDVLDRRFLSLEPKERERLTVAKFEKLIELDDLTIRNRVDSRIERRKGKRFRFG